MNPWHDSWRDWRRRLKARAPFVRRREYALLKARYLTLIDALHGRLTRADEAALRVVRPIPPGLTGEVCVFVTHAAQAEIKSHVTHHAGHFAAAGISVILVVNTDLPPEAIEIPPELAASCVAILVRANVGLDFAAWGHAVSIAERSGWQRLYLVNDSIVGPLSAGAFDTMLGRIRASSADHLGLTWNTQPLRHLQSYFLVFNRRLLKSLLFHRLITGIYNLPDKGVVVDSYEARLTGTLQSAGFRCESAFPEFHSGLGDDPALLTAAGFLERIGFPYAKVSLLRRYASDPRAMLLRQQGKLDKALLG